MNKYIIPYCIIQDGFIGNRVINARSLQECKDKVIEIFGDYSDKDDWNDFLSELNEQDIIIGKITDIEEL